jgi:hypothetical protein
VRKSKGPTKRQLKAAKAARLLLAVQADPSVQLGAKRARAAKKKLQRILDLRDRCREAAEAGEALVLDDAQRDMLQGLAAAQKACDAAVRMSEQLEAIARERLSSPSDDLCRVIGLLVAARRQPQCAVLKEASEAVLALPARTDEGFESELARAVGRAALFLAATESPIRRNGSDPTATWRRAFEMAEKAAEAEQARRAAKAAETARAEAEAEAAARAAEAAAAQAEADRAEAKELAAALRQVEEMKRTEEERARFEVGHTRAVPPASREPRQSDRALQRKRRGPSQQRAPQQQTSQQRTSQQQTSQQRAPRQGQNAPLSRRTQGSQRTQRAQRAPRGNNAEPQTSARGGTAPQPTPQEVRAQQDAEQHRIAAEGWDSVNVGAEIVPSGWDEAAAGGWDAVVETDAAFEPGNAQKPSPPPQQPSQASTQPKRRPRNARVTRGGRGRKSGEPSQAGRGQNRAQRGSRGAAQSKGQMRNHGVSRPRTVAAS